ncbi:MAG: FGGY-family carbohydrate kinase, partial [Thermoanaerobaculia bacterium]
DVLEAMRADSGLALRELRVDGAASRNDLLMQLQADAAGARVVRASVSETTALGAADLAGLAPGIWRSEDEIDAMWKASRIFEPRINAASRAATLERWREAVERSKKWAR